MTIELKRGMVYGPVASRRLGRSLGINLLPARDKRCRFDCVYCQYGATTSCDASRLAGELPAVDQVIAAVEDALRRLPEQPAWLTFSGNGEPTLHPAFPAAVDAIVALRDRLCPQARTSVLSCSTEAGRPEVRSALARLDARIMKLDVGSEEALRRYNRPAAGVTLAGILEGLGQLEEVTLQTLLAGGADGNSTPADVDDWLERVLALRPRAVQLYTLARPTASRDLAPVTRAQLEAVAETLRAAGVGAEVY
jgi:wyosine [tRNA(Phe)-imidazoG37] synthetase (radical SAM superfamily)